MILWAVLTLMIVVAAVGLVLPLVRRQDGARTAANAADLLRNELRAIDGDGDHLTPVQAASLRADVGRRLLAETPAAAPPSRPIGARGLIGLGLGLAALVGVAATGLYARIGRPELAGAPPGAEVQATTASPHQGVDAATLIAQLEARMRQTPNEPDGWRMLGWSYMRTARYDDAARAYGRAAALDPANGEFPSAQGEALTQAAGGQVTPQAETAFKAALSRDPADPRARFYLAVSKEQHGDHTGAMTDWLALLKSAPPDAPWLADVRGAVQRIAAQHHQDLSTELSASPTAPSADQTPAIQQAAPAEQTAMIQGMVARLAARLQASPRDPEGWTQLMRARMVLNDPAAARAAYRQALEAYADSAAQRTAFASAAKALGVPGA